MSIFYIVTVLICRVLTLNKIPSECVVMTLTDLFWKNHVQRTVHHLAGFVLGYRLKRSAYSVKFETFLVEIGHYDGCLFVKKYVVG